MNKANFALIISFLSIFIAVLSLGWNIYRDIVLKARVKVKCMIGFLTNPKMDRPLERIFITVTNFGPGKVQITSLLLKEESFFKKILRKTKLGVLIHDYTDPLSAQIPCELDVGNNKNFLFKVSDDLFLAEAWTHVGIRDSFGRMHWAPKRQVSMAKYSLKEKLLKKVS